MARSRNLKPSFFTNEVLAEVDPLGRILFQGLWCHADRDGRLEYRPKKLKAEILPYDNCDIEALFSALEERGFIFRYAVCDSVYVQVVNFAKHQNPHIKEAASSIPAPGEHHESMVQEQDENGASPADSLNPLPLTLNPQPDSPPNGGVVDGSTPTTTQTPHREIIALYHELLPACSPVRVWNDTRKKYLQSRWREDKKRQNLGWWRKYFAYVSQSAFLTGRSNPKPGQAPFCADLEWLVKPNNMAKVIEGKYHQDAAHV